ncbi:MAG: hypothetical protein ACRDZM_11105 [Acidimicrobiia bacterium]
MSSRRITVVTASLALIALGLAACSEPCEQSLGTYPPEQIQVTGAETVEVPHIAWTCDAFHSDSMDPPPSVIPDSNRQLRIQVTLEPDTDVDVRFGNQQVLLDPAPVEGANTWQVQVPEVSEPLVVRICSEDRRCAMYWVNTYGG